MVYSLNLIFWGDVLSHNDRKSKKTKLQAIVYRL